MLTDQSWVLTPPPTATTWISLLKSPPHWFLPFPLNGNFDAISIKQSRNQMRLNTHRSLTAGQLFLLAEPATGGCCACHFPGVGHQLRGRQLRGFLCVCNKKPERHLSPNPAESFTNLWTHFFSKTLFWCQKTWTQLILSFTRYLD